MRMRVGGEPVLLDAGLLGVRADAAPVAGLAVDGRGADDLEARRAADGGLEVDIDARGHRREANLEEARDALLDREVAHLERLAGGQVDGQDVRHDRRTALVERLTWRGRGWDG